MANRNDHPQPLLPKSMSGLIEIALADARSLDPMLYNPNGRHWHARMNGGPCQVCLAGSVIAGTLDAPSHRNRFPWSFDRDTENKLCAIDSMRCGYWERAFRLVYGFGPVAQIGLRLSTIGKSTHIDFHGWDEFRTHLDSLESKLPALREIEAAAFPSRSLPDSR